ncbi:MAG: TonB-dependent receptor [Gemmatimonadota bacterium]
MKSLHWCAATARRFRARTAACALAAFTMLGTLPSISSSQVPAPAAAPAPSAAATPVPLVRGAIAGRVTDARSGIPLTAVIVRVDGSARATITDDAGRFLLDAIPVGTQALVAQRTGLAPARVPVTVLAQGSTSIVFTMREEASVIAPVMVSATRETQWRTEASATVDVLTGSDVRLARAAHPAGLLKRIPGVYTSQLSGEGHSMAIRQPITTKPMYLYLEDGVPTRATGFFNHNALYEVNLPQSDGIEVLKGPGTALYGSDAIGGVINVLTRPAPTAPAVEASLEGGAFGYGRLLLTGGNTVGHHALRGDLNLTSVKGWRDAAPYDRQSGTIRYDRRTERGITLRTVLTGSRVRQNDVFALSYDQYRERSQVNKSPLAYRRADALRLTTAISDEQGQTQWSVTPYARYNNLGLMPFFNLTFDPVAYNTRNASLGMLARVRRDFAPMRTRIIAGADIDWSPGDFASDSAMLTTAGTGSNRIYQSFTPGRRVYDYDVTFRSASPYLHGEFTPVRRLRLDAGLRYDAIEYRYTTALAPIATGAHRVPPSTERAYFRLSPKAGATYELSRAVNLFASYRAGFRAPSQGQLFTQNSASNTVDLRPVTVGSYETGIRGEIGRRVVYGVSAYDMTISNDIVTFVTTQNTRVATNTGRTRHRGVEGSMGAALSSQVRLDLAYSVSSQRYVTWTPQAARTGVAGVDYSGKYIEGAPRDLANGVLTWTPRFARGGRLAAEWSHTGRYWMDPANTRSILGADTVSRSYGGHELFTVHGNVFLRPGVELFARVSNLLDRTHAEVVSYDAFNAEQYTPGSPRSISAGLRYAWSR